MKQQEVKSMVRYVRAILEENVSSVPLEGVTDVGTISINTVIENVLEKAVESVVKIAPIELFSTPNVVQFGQTSLTLYEYVNPQSVPERVFISSQGGSDGKLYDGDGVIIGKITNITSSLSGVLNNGTVISGYQNNHRTTGAPGIHVFSNYENGGYIYRPDDFLRMLYVISDEWERNITELTPLSSPYVSIARSSINLSVGNSEKPLAVNSFAGGVSSIELYPLTASAHVDLVYAERPKIVTEGGARTINCDDGILHAACFYAAYLVAMIKGYQNAEAYKASALDSLNVNIANVNATSGAPV